MEKVTLTKEILLAARDYIPLLEKETWVAETAPKCFDRLAITADGEPLPPMYMANTGIESRYLMTALVSRYFRLKYEPDESDSNMMTADEYDKWGASHVLCQIDRWKHDRDCKDKCFDLLEDYYDLKKRLSNQIKGLLAAQNDSVSRQNQLMAVQMKELPQMMEQLKELQEKHEKDGADDGDA